MINTSKQGGFVFLMELLLVISVTSVLYGYKITQDRQAQKIEDIKSTASHFAQIISATRDWVSFNAGDATVLSNTMVGVDYLKPPACGGDAANPVSGFLPCRFSSRTLLGQSYLTAVTRTGLNLESVITLSRAQFPNNEDYGVAEIMAQAVRSSPNVPAGPSSGTFMSVQANGGFDFDGTGPYLTFALLTASPDMGVVEATLSNTANTDSWIRTDGSNSMQAAFDMNNNDINNVADIDMGGELSVGGDMIVTGNTSLSGTTLTGVLSTNSAINIDNNQDLVINGGDVILAQFAAPRRLSTAVYDMQDAMTNDTIDTPSCPVGLTRRIFTSFRSVQLGIGGGSLEVIPQVQSLTANPNDYFLELLVNGDPDTATQMAVVVSTKCE